MGRLEDIMDFLLEENYSVFAAGAHKGQVLNPYVVVKSTRAQQYMQFSSIIQYYELLYYGRTLTEVVNLQLNVDEKMKEMRPMIVCTHNTTEPYFDEIVNGYMTSTEYRNMRQIIY